VSLTLGLFAVRWYNERTASVEGAGVPLVIALGDINRDIIARIPRYPEPGGDGVASALWTGDGGSAANTARGLAQCGISAGLIGRVGCDAQGEELLRQLQAAGVDTSLVQRDPDVASGLMFITVTPDGQRTMIGYRGANARTCAEEIDPQAVRTARWLHISGYALLGPPQVHAALYALQVAAAAGLRVSLDPGLEAARQKPALIHSLLDQIDLLLPSEEEARALTGAHDPRAALESLHAQGARTVALKQGPRGCLLSDGGVPSLVPAFPIEVLDTTGAGDAFAAAFLAGQVCGLSLRACGLWANALGAWAASAPGGAMPELAALLAYLRQEQDEARWRGWGREFEALLGLLKGRDGT
jgi:ribokinase